MVDSLYEMQSQSQKPSSPITFRKAFPPSIIGPMLFQILVIVGGLVVGAVYLGKFLDARFNTGPWLTVVLFLIASFIAVPITYRLGMRAIAKISSTEPPPKEAESSSEDTALNAALKDDVQSTEGTPSSESAPSA